MIDFTELLKGAVIAGLPLIFVSMSLAQLVNGFGVTGNAMKATAFGIGFLLGAAYQLATAAPATPAGWLTAFVFAVVMGLGTPGTYDALKSATSK